MNDNNINKLEIYTIKYENSYKDIQQLNIFKITNLEIFDEHRNVLSSKPSHTSSCKSAYHGTLNSKSSFLQKLGENVNLSKQYSRDYAIMLTNYQVLLLLCAV